MTTSPTRVVQPVGLHFSCRVIHVVTWDKLRLSVSSAPTCTDRSGREPTTCVIHRFADPVLSIVRVKTPIYWRAVAACHAIVVLDIEMRRRNHPGSRLLDDSCESYPGWPEIGRIYVS